MIWKHHFIKANFCYALTALFLQAVSKDKRSKRKTFLSIFLFDHLHRPIFTCVIERQTQQKKNVSLNFPFCSSSPPRFYRRHRKTNAATEKRFSQFSFLFIFTTPFLQAASKDKRGNRKTFLSIFFLFIFTAPFLQAASKDKRGKRKTFLSIFLLVHLHRPVFTGGIERQTQQEKNVSFNFLFVYLHRPVFTSVIVKDIMQLIVKIEFFYLYIKNKPRRLSGLCDSLADFPL